MFNFKIIFLIVLILILIFSIFKISKKTKNKEDKLEAGMKVTYCPEYGNKEQGIIKSIDRKMGIAFVVYKCDNKWDKYEDYTGCSTYLSNLKIGWKK